MAPYPPMRNVAPNEPSPYVFPFDLGASLTTSQPLHSQAQPQGQNSASTTPHGLAASSIAPKNRQKTMSSAPRGRNPAGGSARGRSSKSATPRSKAAQSAPKPMLKLKLNTKALTEAEDPKPAVTAQHNDTDELPQYTPTPFTTRTGRTVKQPLHFDDVQDSSYTIDQSSDRVDDGVNSASDSSYESHHGKASLSSQQQSTPRAIRRPQTEASWNTPLPKIDKEYVPVPNTPQAHPSHQEPPTYVPETGDAYQIFDALKRTTKIHLDLPCLTNAQNPELPQPYSAKSLVQIYLLAYQQKEWDLCDVIADTWMRAFHELRDKDQRSDSKDATWRHNKVLEGRKRKAKEAWKRGKKIFSEFDLNPKDYELTIADPELDADVTAVHPNLLNILYKHTDTKCGARMLWADALALGGDKTEKIMAATVNTGVGLHAELVFNVMQTGLRMLRRNLTLKIEESTEGAWCKRYHEHSKYDLPCYREKAWGWKNGVVDGGGDDDDSDGERREMNGDAAELDDVDDFEAMMLEEFDGKRGFGGDGEISGAKRVKRGGDAGDDSDSEYE
ncbi:hypothetical protein PtrSN002B_000420 [Pyrenophora tritici-repentis]|uniref:Cytochrome P450 3A10 n=1 Tax=Pyrenophora tritici-repentis TaxID=45151 RepID=A0A2W1CSN2_9PLEO|nr:hypothetical protein PtrV1_05518 [Pyrenophora tritici-repentis]KAF7450261.1 hypothetical protein A1F99_048770 [Pyrenophora tritici-repentis]KAF7572833.1 cytochrome P450 3A10 [Pyrenophora tritici-repentis]KAI0588157.1 hypothetical protein Alg215_01073 [Pyrenophora tritici-repentis]KAI0592037.1 hypothetical protein Alg130_00638 [Pyrenophora tritici-repentis]